MLLCNDELVNQLNKFSKRPAGKAFSKDSVFLNDAELDASVIIPCYNSQDYLEKCLDSVLNQKTHCTYEVIAVNDGSCDSTPQILARYQESYKQLVVVNQENKGFSGARNAGIRVSKGRFLVFIDSDDYVEGDYIENLVGTAQKKNLDLTACGYMTFRDFNVIKRVSVRGDHDQTLLNGCFWAKAFKREIFNHIVFPEGYWYEDSILAHLIYPQIASFASVDGCFYAYRSNENGITISSRGKAKSIDTFYVSDLMIDSVIECLGENQIRTQEYYELILEQFYLNQSRVKELDDCIQRLIFKVQSDFVKTYYKDKSTEKWKYKKFQDSLRNNDYKGCKKQIKLEKLYKVIELLTRKFGN